MKESTVDLSRGFLPPLDPCLRLPKGYDVWEQLGEQLPKLLLSVNFHKIFDSLPVLSIEGLNSLAELERAMLLLSFLGHAYVWGQSSCKTTIPPSIAVPWYSVAERLARKPVLSYASYALNNWRRLNHALPVELGNIALIQNFLGGLDEEWFVLVHVEIEMNAAQALQQFMPLQAAVKTNDVRSVTSNLAILITALKQMCDTLDRMPEKCDPYIYYNRVRPYIHGWKDNPALPNGVIYEGVTAYQNKPQFFRGETGAQSAIIPSFDALLGIEHQPDPLRVYLLEMQEYMPLSHRQFIHKIEQNGSIRDFIKLNCHPYPLLKDEYNDCITLLSRFRQTHLRYAAHYIQKQHQTSKTNPTAVGTGGTPFMNYLRKHKDETMKFLIN